MRVLGLEQYNNQQRSTKQFYVIELDIALWIKAAILFV